MTDTATSADLKITFVKHEDFLINRCAFLADPLSLFASESQPDPVRLFAS